MGSHPLNLALRFLLELGALSAAGIWGRHKGEGWLRFVWAIAIPIIFAVLWATFRVPNDPGSAPVAVPGVIRLVFELAFFAFAVWALYNVGYTVISRVFGIAVIIHYLISYDRVLWLFKQ